MAGKIRVVIVGAGLGGGAVAAQLRKRGFDGAITVVGAESFPPYERPPLSKAYLRGELNRDGVFSHPAELWETDGVELRAGRTAIHVDRRERQVYLSDGAALRFDWLVLATGSEPRRLPVPGAELDGVLTLRTLADADELRQRARSAEQVLVIGGGWIGSEVTASLRQMGVPVTLAVQSALPLEHALRAEVASVYDELHRGNGARVLHSTSVVEFLGRGKVTGARTSTGQVVSADVVVVAIGADPRLALPAGAGLVVDGSVPVDDRLRTADPQILAIGDIARVPYPYLGRSLRFAHWGAAQFQGVHAAKTILGNDEPYRRFPYVFSDQYDTGMELWGDPELPGELTVRGSLEERSFTAFWHSDGKVAAVLNMHVHSHPHGHADEHVCEHVHDHDHDHEHERGADSRDDGQEVRPTAAPAAHTHSGAAHLDPKAVEALLRAGPVRVDLLGDAEVTLEELPGSAVQPSGHGTGSTSTPTV